MRLKFDELRVFCEQVFSAFGFSDADSRTVTDVLLAADLAGITSHGVQRLVRYHKEINEFGYVDMKSTPEVVTETPVSAVVDAHNGMGQVVSVKAMEIAIRKAKTAGVGMVPVRNSNHFGIAGYYARMAVERGLIGVAMTNSEAIMTVRAKITTPLSSVAIGLRCRNSSVLKRLILRMPTRTNRLLRIVDTIK